MNRLSLKYMNFFNDHESVKNVSRKTYKKYVDGMIYYGIFLIILVILLFFIMNQKTNKKDDYSYGQIIVVVNKDTVMREGDGIEFPVAGYLKKDESVILLYFDHQKCAKVKAANNIEGWINKDFISSQ